MILKVTLKDIWKDSFKRSTLIAIPNITEFFDIPGSQFTQWEVFYQIVREALEKFEYYYPLSLVQKLFLRVDPSSRVAYVQGNFQAYLDGIISEDQIVIVPSSVQGLALTPYTASGYPLRNFRYEPGRFMDLWHTTNYYWANTLCKRPFVEEYDEVTKEPTDRCAIYYIGMNIDSEWKVLRDQIYVELCRYIVNMKKNIMMQNMPIELFAGLEEDMQRVQSEIENLYNTAMTGSSWLI